MDYLDFELAIGTGTSPRYPLSVLRSPGGEAQGTFVLPFEGLALTTKLQALELALMRSGTGHRRILSDEEQAVQEFGGALFEALFNGNIRSVLDVSAHEAARQQTGLRIRLRTDNAALAALPWEFMYDARDGEYVCLSRSTPIARYLEVASPLKPLQITLPLRVLGMVASPADLPPLDIAREKLRLEQAIAALPPGRVELEWLQGSTWRDLQQRLQGDACHVFHFVGHGMFNVASGQGVLAFCDEKGNIDRVDGINVARLLGDHLPLRLAILNSCEGARADQTDVFSSTAAAIVRRGTPACIAMQYPISDVAAIELSRALAQGLGSALPIDAAVAEARKSIALAIPGTLEWGTPVLFTHAADGKLFDVVAGATPVATPASTPVHNPPPVHTPAPVDTAPPVFAPPVAPTPVTIPASTPSREPVTTSPSMPRGFADVPPASPPTAPPPAPPVPAAAPDPGAAARRRARKKNIVIAVGVILALFIGLGVAGAISNKDDNGGGDGDDTATEVDGGNDGNNVDNERIAAAEEVVASAENDGLNVSSPERECLVNGLVDQFDVDELNNLARVDFQMDDSTAERAGPVFDDCVGGRNALVDFFAVQIDKAAQGNISSDVSRCIAERVSSGLSWTDIFKLSTLSDDSPLADRTQRALIDCGAA